MKKNILYISHTSQTGGGEHSLYYLHKEVDKDKFAPIVICPIKGLLTDKLKDLPVKVIIVDQPSIQKMNFLKLFSNIFVVNWRIYKIIKKERVDLIHVNSVRSLFYSILAAKVKAVPILTHIRIYEFGVNSIIAF